MKDALDHIRGYRQQYSYRTHRTKRDRVTSDSRVGVTLASMNMVTDIAEISEEMRALERAEIEQGLEYVISQHPLEAAVKGLAWISVGNKLAAMIDSREIEEEIRKLREFFFAFLPPGEGDSIREHYRAVRPHITLAGFDMSVRPSEKMIEEVKERLPHTVSLAAPIIGTPRK